MVTTSKLPPRIVLSDAVEQVTVYKGGHAAIYSAHNLAHAVDTIVPDVAKGAKFTRTVSGNEKVAPTAGWEEVDPHLALEAQSDLDTARNLGMNRFKALCEVLGKAHQRSDKIDAIQGALGMISVTCRMGKDGRLSAVVLEDNGATVEIQGTLLEGAQPFRDKLIVSADKPKPKEKIS